MSYSYDYTGNLLTASDGATATTTYTYTPASQVSTITSSMSGPTTPSSLVSNVQYGPFGANSYQFGNGLSQSMTYYPSGRPQGSWVCVGSPGPACSAQAYSFYLAWNGAHPTTWWDNIMGQGTTFGYDEFDRLTSANYGNGAKTFSYDYDRYGNRWSQNAPQGGPAPGLPVNKASNQISAFGYDAAGNMTSDGIHTYTYDAEGNITQVDGGSTAKYYYNALNQRVRSDQGSTSREYIYNLSGQRVSIWDGNSHNQVQGQYYWGSTPIAFYSGNALHFQHQDWLGTERVRTSYSGSTEGTYYSLPFGDGYSPSGSDDDAYHFGQLDHDSETDTQHAQFRQYSSTQGRWMSPDPYSGSYDSSNPQSFNRYSYVGNSSLTATDPSGLNPEGGPSNPAGGCVGAVITGGTNPVADTGCAVSFLYNWFSGFFGALGGPSFNGTTQPRPGGTIWDEHGGFHATPYSSIASMIGEVDGISSPGCEFGTCASMGDAFQQGRTPVQNQSPFDIQFIRDAAGRLMTIRIFDWAGRAWKDIDFHDHPPGRGPGNPHQHPWDWNKTPPRLPGGWVVPYRIPGPFPVMVPACMTNPTASYCNVFPSGSGPA